MKYVWAFDLGASNGRLMLCGFDGQFLHLEELHRFHNQPIHLLSNMYWDILNIFQEMKLGIQKSVKKGYKNVTSLGIDTWGVDFGLLTSTEELLGNPYSYRDPQNTIGYEAVLSQITRQEWFKRSGVEPSPINTICQLAVFSQLRPEIFNQANTLLLTPNLLNYFFSGVKVNEYTISTTTGMYSYEDQDWDEELLRKLGISKTILAPVVKPCTILGETLESINQELSIDPVKVIACAGHDTACALAALPITGKNVAFMSCGTWILMGIQVKEPIVNQEALNTGFTNEGTLDGEYRFLKNSMGLWLLQQSKAQWEKEGTESSYSEDDQFISESASFKCFIDPDDPVFFNPENMPNEIQSYCRRTNQFVPGSKGEILRVILESLALKYKWVFKKLEKFKGEKISVIHMGGGGIQNKWLCQFVSNATNCTVIAGPIEASSIGNAVGQFIALGEISGLEEARAIVKRSFPTKRYDPQENEKWEVAYKKFIQTTDLHN